MIRNYKPEDLAAIEAMVPGDVGYKMPQLEHPLMLVRKVLVDENDRPRMAVFGRLHVNALLFVDHGWRGPQERLEALKALQTAAMDEARDRGLDIATTQVDTRFGARLLEFGWIKGYGEIYFHDL